MRLPCAIDLAGGKWIKEPLLEHAPQQSRSYIADLMKRGMFAVCCLIFPWHHTRIS